MFSSSSQFRVIVKTDKDPNSKGKICFVDACKAIGQNLGNVSDKVGFPVQSLELITITGGANKFVITTPIESIEELNEQDILLAIAAPNPPTAATTTTVATTTASTTARQARGSRTQASEEVVG